MSMLIIVSTIKCNRYVFINYCVYFVDLKFRYPIVLKNQKRPNNLPTATLVGNLKVETFTVNFSNVTVTP